MSIEDLRDHGVLLPEEEWGEHRLETTTPELPLALTFAAGVGAWLFMYVGEGGLTTWIGTGAFLVTVFVMTLICDRAILRQRERFREERREFGAGDED